jgi:HK97 gp10 family phage protein
MIDVKTVEAGLKKVIEEVGEETFRTKLSIALNRYGNNVRNIAVKKTPVDTGNLRASNFVDLSSPENLQIVVGNSSNYAAYVEFGTGIHAAKLLPNYPKEWQDVAKDFYIDGSGNGPAQPFLYPAVVESEKLLMAELDKLFK